MIEITTWIDILKGCIYSLYILCFIVALIRFKRYHKTPFRFFPVILLMETTKEILAKSIVNVFDYNAFLYNFTNTILFIYMLYLFYYYLNISAFKRSVYIFILVFGSGTVVNLFTENAIEDPLTFSYFLGGVLLILSVILYYIQLLDDNKVISVKHDLLLWLGTGQLLFYTGYIPIKLFRLSIVTESVNEAPILRIVHLILIILMYVCFLIGLLWMRRRHNLLEYSY